MTKTDDEVELTPATKLIVLAILSDCVQRRLTTTNSKPINGTRFSLGVGREKCQGTGNKYECIIDQELTDAAA